jgi:branched-chain amino acid transport system substrate-binding protein
MSDENDVAATPTTRRDFLKKAGVTGAVLAGGVPLWARPAGAYSRLTKTPIKIGYFTALTGSLSVGGIEGKRGFDLYLEKINNTIAGRPVQVIAEDDGGNPAISLQKVQKLTEQDKCSIIVGGINAASGPPVFNYVNAVGIPWVVTAIATDNLTQRDEGQNEYMVRCGKSASQGSHYLAEWVRKHHPEIKNVALVGADFLLGYESGGGFQDVFQRMGGAVVQRIFIPLGTADAAPFISRIDTSVDAVYAILDSLNSIHFLTSYLQFGLKDKIPLFTGYVTSDENVLASNVPAQALLGNISESGYSAVLDNPANYDFERRYNAKYSGISVGGSTTIDNWIGMQFCEAAIKRRGGDVSNRRKLAHAFMGLSIDTPRGKVTIDADHNASGPVYIRRVDKAGSKVPPGYTLPYQNTVLATIPKASQWWKFQKAGYLARPRYTRDFPPVHAKK